MWQCVNDSKKQNKKKLLEMNAALMQQSAAHKALDERRSACSEKMRRQFDEIRRKQQASAVHFVSICQFLNLNII